MPLLTNTAECWHYMQMLFMIGAGRASGAAGDFPKATPPNQASNEISRAAVTDTFSSETATTRRPPYVAQEAERQASVSDRGDGASRVQLVECNFIYVPWGVCCKHLVWLRVVKRPNPFAGTWGKPRQMWVYTHMQGYFWANMHPWSVWENI